MFFCNLYKPLNDVVHIFDKTKASIKEVYRQTGKSALTIALPPPPPPHTHTHTHTHTQKGEINVFFLHPFTNL